MGKVKFQQNQCKTCGNLPTLFRFREDYPQCKFVCMSCGRGKDADLQVLIETAREEWNKANQQTSEATTASHSFVEGENSVWRRDRS